MSTEEPTATTVGEVTYVPKACAYVTRDASAVGADGGGSRTDGRGDQTDCGGIRDDGRTRTDGEGASTGRELLVFEGPGHDGLQIPKGTVEPGETPREAVFREVAEESGLGALGDPRHVATDVWTRRRARRYVRHFFHVTVHDPRDRWTHTVTGEGEETGAEFEFSWVDLPPADEFALSLDDYVHLLG